MIFNTKNKFAQLVESEQTKDESLLIQIVQTTWDQFNDFVSSNLRMLLIYLKDIAYLNFRQRDNLTTLKSTLRGQGSASDSDKSKSDLELTIKNNGLIFHDFNYPDYVNQLFADDEVKHKQLAMTAYEPDQSVLKRDKLSVEKVIEESLTPYQLEMRKMRAIVKKAEMYKNEQITGAQEFRAQFTDLMKNINQSYTILKGGIAENKKNKDEKGEKSSFADDSALTSLNLFTKLKGKKKFNISEVKPRLKTATRIPSAVVKPVSQPVDGSQRRLSRPRSRQHTESSIKYEDSETGVKVILALAGACDFNFREIAKPRASQVQRHP